MKYGKPDVITHPDIAGTMGRVFGKGGVPTPRNCRICGQETAGNFGGKYQAPGDSLCWTHSPAAKDNARHRQSMHQTDWERIQAKKRKDDLQAQEDRRAGILYRVDKVTVYDESGLKTVVRA